MGTKRVSDKYYGDFTLTLEPFDYLSVEQDGQAITGNSYDWCEHLNGRCEGIGLNLEHYTQNGHVDWCRVVFDNFEELLQGCLGYYFEE